MDISGIFFERAKDNPDKIAVWNEDESITYGNLKAQINKLSNIFTESGVVYGEHIGILLHNSITFVATVMACANLGVTIVPLNPELPKPAILKAFSAADVKHVLATKAFYDDEAASAKQFSGACFCVDGEAKGALSLQELYKNAKDVYVRTHEISGNEPLILTMTSGSTGDPKPIVLTQKNKVDRAMSAINLYDVTEKDFILAATPLYHSLAERLVFMPLLSGATSVLMSRYTPELWLKQVTERGVTFTIAVSSQLAQIAEILASPFCPEISTLRCVVSSSALLESHIKTELLAKFNCEIHECYGASEIAIATNLNLSDSGKQLNSVGKAIPDVKIRIMREDGTQADIMEKGEIQCKTPLLFGGYYKQSENTKNSMQDGYFRTGDLGYVNQDGYLYFAGRIKDLIITGAVNVYPIDVEEAVLELETIRECAAFALPDDRLGEIVAIAVVPKNAEDFNVRTLKIHCAQKLADYQIPRKYFLTEELPRNPMGKIMKKELVAKFAKPQEQQIVTAAVVRPLKIGFLGGGTNSAIGYAHMSASGMDKLFSLEAGCFSRNDKTNINSAEVFGVEGKRAYPDWKSMLERERGTLDAVAVLLPIPGHFETVQTALELGIPVICEKPLAMNLKQVEALKNVCQKHKGFLTITYNYTGYPMVREMRQMIRDGKIGEILHFTAEMPQESYVRDSAAPQAWRLEETKPPLVSLDLLTHIHNLIEYLLEEQPVKVFAIENSFGRFSGITDDCRCITEYTKDIKGQYWISKSSAGSRNGMKVRIFGTKGSIEWVQEFPEQIRLSFTDGSMQVLDRGSVLTLANLPRYVRFKAGHPAGYIEAFANLYKDISDALHGHLNGKEIRNDEITLIDSEIDRFRFLEAVSASAKSGRWEVV